MLMVLQFLLIPTIIAIAGEYSSDFTEYLADNQNENFISAIISMTDKVDIANMKSELANRKATRRETHEAVVTTLWDKAQNTQSFIIEQLKEMEKNNQVESYKSLWIDNIIVVKATQEALDILVMREDVSLISPNYKIELIKPIDEKISDSLLTANTEIGLERIRVDELWPLGFTGKGRLVCNFDTGVDGTHDALESRWRGNDSRYVNNPGWAWFDPVTSTDFPFDSDTHGTHTMGTICGLDESTDDTIGVAFGAEWISAGFLDRVSIPQTISDAILSFQWVVDPDEDPSTVWDVPDVCSNSYGTYTIHGYPPCYEALWGSIDAVEAAGIVVLFSAGNFGSDPVTLASPADRATTDLTAFSVGAVDGNSNNLPIASFSSRGPSYCTESGSAAIKPEVVAPGINVRSSIPGGYGTKTGTSMACPYVAGVVALMRQADPNLTVDEIKQILLNTATDLGTSGEDNDYGKGIIDAYEALESVNGGAFIRSISPSSYTLATTFAAPVYRTIVFRNDFGYDWTYEITSYPSSWIVFDSNDLSGIVSARSSKTIAVAFDPHSHEVGEVLSGNIVIETNYSPYSSFTIPCQLTVVDRGGDEEGCFIYSCSVPLEVTLCKNGSSTQTCRITNDMMNSTFELLDVDENASWLSISGLLCPQYFDFEEYDEFTIRFDAAGLDVGQYTTDILFYQDSGCEENPFTVPVILTVLSYGYLPGDANMSAGTWPPSVISSDVTYLVNYFRGLNTGCLMDGFYCSADANGTCTVTGSDATRIVNYLRGMIDLTYCPNYLPAWPITDDLPDDAPAGWPGCATSKTIISTDK